MDPIHPWALMDMGLVSPLNGLLAETGLATLKIGCLVEKKKESTPHVPPQFPCHPMQGYQPGEAIPATLLRVLYLQEVDENPLCKYPSPFSPTRYLPLSTYGPLCYSSLCFAERIPE